MRNRPFLFWGFKSPRDLFAEGLGPLERDTMDVVWRTGTCTVRDVHAALGGSIAYTTVMTTLDRLFKKQFLVRTRRGRAFVYAPAASRQDVETAIAGDVVRACLANQSGVQPVLSHLVEAVSEHDRAWLDELERLIREKRRVLDARDWSGIGSQGSGIGAQGSGIGDKGSGMRKEERS